MDLNPHMITILASIFASAAGAYVTHLLSVKKNEAQKKEVEKIRNSNIELERIIASQADSFEIINDVADVLAQRITKIVEEIGLKHKDLEILNLGLDLAYTCPWYRHKIVENEKLDDIHVNLRTLIINPDSDLIKKYCNEPPSNLSSDVARSSIEEIKKFAADELLDRFSITVRKYSMLPVIHGFLINDEHLFMGFSEIKKAKIIAGPRPYIYLRILKENNPKLNLHLLDVYKSWFEYYWELSEEAVHIEK